jgi:hypothetical protein
MYGYATSNYSTSSLPRCSAYSHCHITRENAFSFTPATSVTSREVTVPLFSSNPSAQYEVNIYSSVGGLPGNVLAHSKKFTASDTALCCTASRTVTIKANLIAGRQYFIGVSGVCCNADGGWEFEDTNLSGAAVDYWHQRGTYTYSNGTGKHTYTSSSPWHASTYHLPTTGAVILK